MEKENISEQESNENSPNVFAEAIRVCISFMELNRQQNTKIQYLIMMIRALLTVIIVEIGVLIGLISTFMVFSK